MIYRILKLLWLFIALSVLVLSLIVFDGKPNSDADLVLIYGMLVVSFPISLVALFLLGLLGKILYSISGYQFNSSYALIIGLWTIFVVVGYWQWFVLLPRLVRKWKSKQSRIKVTVPV